MHKKVHLFDLSRAELEAFVQDLGEPRYRADQIWAWLYRHLAVSFDEMTNLPTTLRQRLKDVAVIHTISPVAEMDSQATPARKVLFQLEDSEGIEAVLMHYRPGDPDFRSETAGEPLDESGNHDRGRHTACISTQVGCAMGCVFCATGQMGLLRQMSAGEVIEQVIYLARELGREGKRLTNLVFMGMGEPLANWPATWQTVETLNDRDGFNLGARRMTISTVGLVPGIRKLAQAGIQVRLAVSIHAPNNTLRNQLVPINVQYPLEEVMDACREYLARTKRRITFEYVMIDHVNDFPEQAEGLAGMIQRMLCHVNLIPLNPTPGSDMRPSPYSRCLAFQNVLKQHGIPTTLRVRRGIDVQAGCGQLRTRLSQGLVGRTIAQEQGKWKSRRP
ncbi:MAG: 23S rRNA (adenine(2503)-C(2))-methyltransferase RlmN [Chloroflexi bacterium]|nr:MAG: 23S rRNA (adenine(2503)-C(2))-methyltransferase RlmN [Chloroflexota bacterium]